MEHCHSLSYSLAPGRERDGGDVVKESISGDRGNTTVVPEWNKGLQ